MVIDDIKFNEKGLIPAIAQDYKTGEVLMMAYMNEESLEKTLETGRSWFYSRSREELWERPQEIHRKLRKCSMTVTEIACFLR